MDITTTMDSELKATYEHMPAFPVPKNANDFAALRKIGEESFQFLDGVKNDHVVIEDRIGPHAPGAVDVPVRLYTPRSRTGLLPGLLWMHGSGFTVGTPKMDDGLLTRIVEEVGCVVVSVDYRLAPEHSFPSATYLPPECSEFWYLAYHTLFWLDFYLSGTRKEDEFAPPAPFVWTEIDDAPVSPEQPYTKEELHSYLVATR